MEVELRVTNLCQLRCRHCYINAGVREGNVQKIIWDEAIIDLVTEFLKVLVEKITSNNLSSKVLMKFSGGEPMLLGAKRLAYFSEKLSKNVTYSCSGIVSNFLNYNSEIGKIAKEYNWVVFASYDPVVRFGRNSEIEVLFQRKVKQALEDGLDVILSVVMTKELFKTDILQYARSLGVSKIYLAPYVQTGRGKEAANYLCPSREEVVEYIKHFYSFERDIKIIPFDDFAEMYNEFIETGKGSIECWSDCYNDFGINPDLSITSIGMCFDGGYEYGRVYRPVEEAVEEVISSHNRIEFMKYKLFSDKKCLRCEFFGFCRGGCLSYEKHSYVSECRGLKSLLEFLKGKA